MDKQNISILSSALLGMAYGEAFSWSSMFQRSKDLPPWLGRIRHEIEAESKAENITSNPKPFSLNQSPEPLKPAAGDLTEWAAWTTTLLVENEGILSHKTLEDAWRKLTKDKKQIRGRLSIQAALRNLESGMTAPQSGRFNPHYFDDAALGRAMVIGLVNSGNVALAQEQAGLDASFTQFEDGIWSAEAIAALFSMVGSATSPETLIEVAIQNLPEGSLVERCVVDALEGCDSHESNVLTTADYLNREVCNQIYSYGNIAHEILACLLVILRTSKGDFNTMVACASLVPSPGSGLLALATALAAVLNPQKIQVIEDLKMLKGLSLPEMKDVDLIDLSTRFEGVNEPNVQQNEKSRS